MQFCIGDASLIELPIEHRVWHRSVVSGRVGGARGLLHSHQVVPVLLTASLSSNLFANQGLKSD